MKWHFYPHEKKPASDSGHKYNNYHKGEYRTGNPFMTLITAGGEGQ